MIYIIWREEGKGWTDAVTTTTRRQKPIRGGGGSRWRQEEKFVAWQPVSAGFRVGGERERRGARPADTGIDYEERPHPLPPFAAALRGWPATAATHAASREKSCAVVVPESLRLCPGSKDQFQALLEEDFQFYQLMILLRGCLDDTSSWNFLILLSVNGIIVKYCLLNYLLIYSLEKLMC